MLRTPRSFRSTAAPCRQRGVYALEWALVFVVFFMLLYAIVGFGLGFLVRESMQWAAEDGARAALQFQDSRETRRARALEVVQGHLAWLPGELRASIDDGDNFSFMVCRLGDEASCTASMAAEAMECDIDRNAPCMLQLRLTLPYARHPFTPSLTLGLLELGLPDLQAQAQLLVDQKGF
ncbi:TadE/TadG family type IV pilus assembly protein [Comamonas endophytica]|uniref:Pilus assembly protein n=1 Tax=Comamonas endophytica TaxID=2949090 RepID=A0ABY6GA38_9BURK|nr:MULTISPECIES: TadE/TadG family type IV pilus assembly protein [unclassified Acidovorax]MCD2512156.1 pilus assembly protein [Acidovorax sp. D4N7]UYG51929.1 pilus assembly protein [Acidovorax sp. 5MLIR]